MTLDRPWALLLLAVPALLLWLRLRALRPREAEASSLLVWKKVSQSDTIAARPRPPLAAWLEAAGAALLALGAADPRSPGPAPRPARFVIDGTASMGARAPGGMPRGESAVAELDGIDLRSFAAGTYGRETVFTIEAEARDPAGRAADGAAAGDRVVLVTDHRLPAFPAGDPGLSVVGVGARGPNAGITAAAGEVLPDGRWRLLLVLEAFGAEGPVEGTLDVAGAAERVTLQPATPLEVVREIPAPAGDGPAEARAAFPGDVLPADDAVSLRRRGGDAVEFRLTGDFPGFEPWRRAFLASGARASEGAGRPPRIGLSGSGGRTVEILLPFLADPPPGEPGAGGDVEGLRVAAGDHPLVRDVRVDPGVTLGRRRGPAPSGVPLLSDDGGCLVSCREEGGGTVLEFGFDPGGTWVERDPSFVVFAKNIVDHAAGGPARVEAEGVLDAGETREAAEGESFGDLRAALEQARRPDPADRASLALAAFAAGAILLAGAWFASR